MANLVVSMRIITLTIWMFATSIVFAGDTLRIMHYNLLNYRNSTAQCDGNNNDAIRKDAWLKSLVQHVKPHILTCNEIGANLVNAGRILDNALNTDGVTYFDQAQFTNNGFSSITNMLFYDTRRLGLKGQVTLKKDRNQADLLRVIDIYTLYDKASAGNSPDTLQLKVIVAHLKAGNTSDDKLERAKMTEALMDYIASQTRRFNYILCGDLNVQSAQETAFQNLISHPTEALRFFDPADAIGTWNENGNFANLHTQSTRSVAGNTCFSGGGMDDRFDFILMSEEVKDHKLKLEYLEQSYRALGNDGKRFNGDINGSTNKSLPQNLLDALYGLSDHVPVVAEFKWQNTPVAVRKPTQLNLNAHALSDGSVRISLKGSGQSLVHCSISDCRGYTVYRDWLMADENEMVHTPAILTKPGLYFLEAVSSDKRFVNRLLVFTGNPF